MRHQYAEPRVDAAKIYSKLIQYLTSRGLRFALTVNSNYLSSLFIRIACRTVEGYSGLDKSRIWMLGKDGLTEDFISSVSIDKWAIPIEFYRGIPKIIARHYLPEGIDDNSYESDDETVKSLKMQYRKEWQEIFRALRNNRPHAITTGNFGYYAEREMAAAAELEGIPFIAMHKECLKSKGRLSFFKSVYQRRGRFQGRKILVYNQREKDLQISSGVAESDQVAVCGMPRLDRLHQWRNHLPVLPQKAPTLLALGFSPKTGLPRIPRKGTGGSTVATYEYLDPEHEKLGWDNFFMNYHDVLVKLAVDNPGYRVLLKLKARERDAEPSVKLVESLDPPENFEIIVGGDPIELIQNAHVVCGFNTTAVLEGLAAGLPVVTPEFDEVTDTRMRDFAASFGKATFRPEDPKAMYDILNKLMKRCKGPTQELSVDVKQTLDLWVSNSDGRSGQRVKQVFEREMNTQQSAYARK